MTAVLRLTWVEVKLFAREPIALIFVFVFPFFMLFVLGGVFGNQIDTTDQEEVDAWSGVGPMDYYQPAYIGLVMASVGLITMPLRLATYRERGILRRFQAAGVANHAILASQMLVGLAMLTIGAFGIVIASTITWGTGFADSWPLTLAAFAFSALTFGVMGLMLGSVLPGSRAAQGAGLILFFVMLLISGSGPPRGVLTSGMRAFSDVLPLTHVVLLLQHAWLHGKWDANASLVTAGFLAVSAGITWRFFRWE